MRDSKIFANSETYSDMRSLPVSRSRREGWAPGAEAWGALSGLSRGVGLSQAPGEEAWGALLGLSPGAGLSEALGLDGVRRRVLSSSSWFRPPQLETALSGRTDPAGTSTFAHSRFNNFPRSI